MSSVYWSRHFFIEINFNVANEPGESYLSRCEYIYIHCSIGRDRQIVGWRVVVVVIVLCSLSRSIVWCRAGCSRQTETTTRTMLSDWTSRCKSLLGFALNLTWHSGGETAGEEWERRETSVISPLGSGYWASPVWNAFWVSSPVLAVWVFHKIPEEQQVTVYDCWLHWVFLAQVGPGQLINTLTVGAVQAAVTSRSFVFWISNYAVHTRPTTASSPILSLLIFTSPSLPPSLSLSCGWYLVWAVNKEMRGRAGTLREHQSDLA